MRYDGVKKNHIIPHHRSQAGPAHIEGGKQAFFHKQASIHK